jgi:hypothetical protein
MEEQLPLVLRAVRLGEVKDADQIEGPDRRPVLLLELRLQRDLVTYVPTVFPGETLLGDRTCARALIRL